MKVDCLFRRIGLAMLIACALQDAYAAKSKTPQADKLLAKFAGEYSGETRTKTESLSQSEMQEFSLKHHSISLSLGKDGSATVMQSPHGDDQVTYFGHFQIINAQVVVTFDPPADGKPAPLPMTFTSNHHELDPVAYDHTLWPKLPPPTLLKTGSPYK